MGNSNDILQNTATLIREVALLKKQSTDDKVFLLSVEEVTNPAFGFSNSTGESRTRQKKCCDYALAASGGAAWWLRSPSGRCSNDARCVQVKGDVNSMDVNFAICGVVPALQIRL